MKDYERLSKEHFNKQASIYDEKIQYIIQNLER